jgi:hypothetical protein
VDENGRVGIAHQKYVRDSSSTASAIAAPSRRLTDSRGDHLHLAEYVSRSGAATAELGLELVHALAGRGVELDTQLVRPPELRNGSRPRVRPRWSQLGAGGRRAVRRTQLLGEEARAAFSKELLEKLSHG